MMSSRNKPDIKCETIKNDNSGYVLAKNPQGKVGEASYVDYHLTYLYVLKEFRGQKIGKMLFDQAISDMQHCKKIEWRSTKKSVGFYEKQGGVVTQPDPLGEYVTDNTVHMSLNPTQMK